MPTYAFWRSLTVTGSAGADPNDGVAVQRFRTGGVTLGIPIAGGSNFYRQAELQGNDVRVSVESVAAAHGSYKPCNSPQLITGMYIRTVCARNHVSRRFWADLDDPKIPARERRGHTGERRVALIGPQELEEAASEHLLLRPADRALEAPVDGVARHGCGAVDDDEEARRRIGDLAEEVAKLKAQEGKPIIAHGGASFARSLVAEGLIDQYDLLVHPVALGKGLPVFSDLAMPRPLKLMSSRAFPAGSVAQIYRPA